MPTTDITCQTCGCDRMDHRAARGDNRAAMLGQSPCRSCSCGDFAEDGPTIVADLPPLFYEDHTDRGLAAGRFVKYLAKRVRVELNEDAYGELLGDALAYSDHRDFDAEFGDRLYQVCGSARATVKRLLAMDTPWEKPAERRARELAERTPEQQAELDRERAELAAHYAAERAAKQAADEAEQLARQWGPRHRIDRFSHEAVQTFRNLLDREGFARSESIPEGATAAIVVWVQDREALVYELADQARNARRW